MKVGYRDLGVTKVSISTAPPREEGVKATSLHGDVVPACSGMAVRGHCAGLCLVAVRQLAERGIVDVGGISVVPRLGHHVSGAGKVFGTTYSWREGLGARSVEPMESGQQEAMVRRRSVGSWETLMGYR